MYTGDRQSERGEEVWCDTHCRRGALRLCRERFVALQSTNAQIKRFMNKLSMSKLAMSDSFCTQKAWSRTFYFRTRCFVWFEARTRGPSVSSQALYHWATALPPNIFWKSRIDVVERKITICSNQESNLSRWNYRQTLYHVAVRHETVFDTHLRIYINLYSKSWR